jgi:hypothetical protein
MQYFTNLLAMVRRPFYSLVPIFDPDTDLSYIPDGGTHVVLSSPVETPDSARTIFTFTSAPQYVCFNGTWLIPNIDYTQSGVTVTLARAPQTGATLRAVI